jgi:hypothetical protein
MKKVDLYKEQKELYFPKSILPVEIDVPEFWFLMIDGKGNPNTSKEYQNSVQALFSLSYTIKFMLKKGKEQIDYKVLPLEGLWWAEDMNDFMTGNKENWLWTMMIRQPEFVTKEHVAMAFEQLKKKKPEIDYSKVRFEKFKEGTSVQMMYIGPFTDEGPAITKIHEYIKSRGNKVFGKHHEIYLSDIRKADPEKWRTVIRQPYV